MLLFNATSNEVEILSWRQIHISKNNDCETKMLIHQLTFLETLDKKLLLLPALTIVAMVKCDKTWRLNVEVKTYLTNLACFVVGLRQDRFQPHSPFNWLIRCRRWTTVNNAKKFLQRDKLNVEKEKKVIQRVEIRWNSKTNVNGDQHGSKRSWTVRF